MCCFSYLKCDNYLFNLNDSNMLIELEYFCKIPFVEENRLVNLKQLSRREFIVITWIKLIQCNWCNCLIGSKLKW